MSRMRLAAIHQSPNSLTRLRPNVFGSAAPVRHRCHPSPPIRKRSRGTSFTSKSIGKYALLGRIDLGIDEDPALLVRVPVLGDPVIFEAPVTK